eukprot:Colp12_sorted_trinity150504_noHs@20312
MRVIVQQFGVTCLAEFVDLCLSKLYLVRCNSSFELLLSLANLQQLLTIKSNVRMIVIDSISAFYWIDRSEAPDNYGEQISYQVQAVSILKRLIDEFGVVIMATKPTIFKSGATSQGLDLVHKEYLSKAWQSF